MSSNPAGVFIILSFRNFFKLIFWSTIVKCENSKTVKVFWFFDYCFLLSTLILKGVPYWKVSHTTISLKSLQIHWSCSFDQISSNLRLKVSKKPFIHKPHPLFNIFSKIHFELSVLWFLRILKNILCIRLFKGLNW